MTKHCGTRDFIPALVKRIAQVIDRHPDMKRTPLSRLICEVLEQLVGLLAQHGHPSPHLTQPLNSLRDRALRDGQALLGLILQQPGLQ
jgi:hypothetical protein